jgi:hypothetical protein
MLAVPPPPMESLAVIEHAAPRRRPHMPLVKSINTRRTVVPIFLTVGFFFILGGVLKFFVGEDSPMHDFPNWVPAVLIVLGLASWAIAVLNMLSIRTKMAEQEAMLAEPR